LCDAQTSGGLLISVGKNDANIFLRQLKKNGVNAAAVIGKVTEKGRGKIMVGIGEL